MLRRIAPFCVLSLLAAAPAAAQRTTVELDTLRASVGSRVSTALPVATRAVEVITAEDLRAAPVRTLADALAWAQGVELMPRSPAQADLSVRGSTFEQVLVLVDGVRMNDPQSGHFALDLALPLSQIERIEILRGAASAIYGADAVGGVINIITRRGGSALEARAEMGSFGSQAVGLATRTASGGRHADLGVDYARSDGHRAGTDYDMLQLRGSAGAPLAGRELRLDVSHARRDFGAEDFYGAYPSYEETRTTTATLAWLATAGERFSIEPRLSARHHGDDYFLKREDPTFYHNQHRSWQWGGEATARYVASRALRLALGGEAVREELESYRIGATGARSDALGVRGESRAAGFAEAALGEFGKAALNAGLRADWHSAFGTFWTPSLSGAWWPRADVRLRASAGRAFRAPTWTDRFYRDPQNIGDPNLDPERAWTADAGVEWSPVGGVKLGLGGFVRRTEGLIDWAKPVASPSEPWHTRNVKDATFRGLEADAALRDPFGTRWTAQAVALSVDAADQDGYLSKYALRPLSQSWSVAAEREITYGLSLLARARGAKRAGDEAYLLADARLNFAWQGSRFYVDAQNLGGTRYTDVVGKPAAGRAFSVGVEWGT